MSETNDMTTEDDVDPLLGLMADIRGQFDLINQRLARLEEEARHHRFYTQQLAEAVTKLCAYNAHDGVDSAILIALMKKLSPHINEAAIKIAAEHPIVQMRKMGRISDLLELEEMVLRERAEREAKLRRGIVGRER